MAAKPLPSSSVGWWALWLAAAVVLYPLYWSTFLLFPIAARQLTALVLMMLAASLFAVGELLLPH